MRPSVVPASSRPISKDNSEAISTSGSKSYILNSKDVLTRLDKSSRWTQLVSLRMREAYAKRLEMGKERSKRGRSIEKEWAWDENTAEAVHERLRKKIVSAFKAYAKAERAGAEVIHLSELQGRDYSTTDKPLVSNVKIDIEDPQQPNISHPVYDLAPLLLPEDLDEIDTLPNVRVYDPEDPDNALVVVPYDTQTVKLHLALQKLGTYLGKRVPDKWVVMAGHDWETTRIDRGADLLIALEGTDYDTDENLAMDGLDDDDLGH